jgi:hypothetical protein
LSEHLKNFKHKISRIGTATCNSNFEVKMLKKRQKRVAYIYGCGVWMHGETTSGTGREINFIAIVQAVKRCGLKQIYNQKGF